MYNAVSTAGEARGRFGRRCSVLVLVIAAVPLLGAPCSAPQVTAPGGPVVSVTLNSVSDELNELLIVPPSDFVVNVSWQLTEASVDPDSLSVVLMDYAGQPVWVPSVFTATEYGSVAHFRQIETGIDLLPGTYRVSAEISDVLGATSSSELDFAIRDFPTSPPIGQGQIIWYDFEADRDAVPGPDFAVDLEHFGLASATAPSLSSTVRASVIGTVLDRVAEAYHDGNPNGLTGGDPVQVTFTTSDPGVSDTTRICVGGAHPTGGGAIGSILIDPDNANRESVECGTLPPSGVFAREMLAFSFDTFFQSIFDPLRPAAGGTAVGDDPLDAIVLDPGFDPATASPDELDRFYLIDNAIWIFSNALGTIVAHETGHALGLVAPAAPGVGLYGGQNGVEFSHNVMPDGSSPSENYLMNSGNTFTFSNISGRAGQPMPGFRPLNLAYLRDRAVLDSNVTALLPPPGVDGVSPSTIVNWIEVLTITGSNFAATPQVRLVGDAGVYYCSGEQLVSAQEMTATVVKPQIYPGTYDLELTNADGQVTVLPDAVTVVP